MICTMSKWLNGGQRGWEGLGKPKIMYYCNAAMRGAHLVFTSVAEIGTNYSINPA